MPNKRKRPQARKHYEDRRALAAAATPVPNRKKYKRPAPGTLTRSYE